MSYMQVYYPHLPRSLELRKREDFALSEEERQEMSELEQNAFKGNLTKVEINIREISGNNAYDYDPYSTTDLRLRAFWYAAYGGRIFVMEEFGCSLDLTYRGDTPLHAAARKAQEIAVAYLVFLKADVNARNEKGQTALHVLLSEKDEIPEASRKAVAQYLLSEGAFPDLPDPENNGLTPRTLLQQRWNLSVKLSAEQIFFQAIEMGDLQTFSEQQRNFQSGVILNQRGEPPFHRILLAPIARSMKIKMIQTLASERRGWIQSQDQQGQTALLCAVKKGELELTRVLLASKADPNLSDENKKTPLHFAATSDFVSLLFSYEASLEAQDSGEATPLHKAAQHGRVSVIRTLCELGAKVKVIDLSKDTPLHVAPNLECARHFLGCKELLNARNMWGHMPLHRAILREAFDEGTGTLDLIEALFKAGADPFLPSYKTYNGLVIESPFALAKNLLKSAKKQKKAEAIYVLEQIVEYLTKAQKGGCVLS